MPVKQVIVIRKDLKMRRGKEIAQGSHSCMGFLLEQIKDSNYQGTDVNNESGFIVKFSSKELEWIKSNRRKVCVRVNSEQELLAINNAAAAAGLNCYLIQDDGLTEFKGNPTYTCCAIGPDDEEKIDAITGKLELY